ncbi:MAG: 5'-3' exonuclease [Actinomycetes bacterium]
MTAGPLLLAVDGNSLLHRSYHALERTQLRTRGGKPSWAVKGVWGQLLAAIDRLAPDAVLIAFDDAGNNDRKKTRPDYKAGRSEKHPDLVSQLALAPAHFTAAGLTCVVSTGCEADDVLATAASDARAAGWRSMIVSSDRDAFALIDETTSVLRIINGGVDNSPVLTPDRLDLLAGIRPEQYVAYAALRGDTSDNLPGVRGIGEKTAVRLLAAFPTVEAAWSEIDSGGNGVALAIGKANAAKLAAPDARTLFSANFAMMTMRTDLALPDLESMRIPVDARTLDAELDKWSLASVRRDALRLVGAPTGQVPTSTPTPTHEEPDDGVLMLWEDELPVA